MSTQHGLAKVKFKRNCARCHSYVYRRLAAKVGCVYPHNLRMNITLVEDKVHTRDRITLLLSRCLPEARVISFDRLATALAHVQVLPTLMPSLSTDHPYWLVDLGLPDGSGIDLIRAVRAHDALAHILVISVFGDVDNVVRSIQAGANGYLLKDAIEADLASAISAMAEGGTPLSPMIASRLLDAMLPAKPRTMRATAAAALRPATALASSPAVHSPPLLTAKESELLNLLSRGYTYAESAERMDVMLSTVQTHVRNIYTKLAVRSKSEAIFEAKVMGLL
jgi:DNA-binding NarL/FixJ family response regulator